MERCSRDRVRPTWPIGLLWASLCLVCFSGAGCSCWPWSASGEASALQPCGIDSRRDPENWAFPEKADLGYTLVFPGIWAIQQPDRSIVTGLVQAQTPSAIEIYDWTAGPLLLFYNLCAQERNRREAQTIARKIMAYQDRYPGRPVNLVGYSGGAAMAVFVLEALPPDRKVSSTVLLAACLSPDYDLHLALSRSERGIHSFYSPLDVTILMLMTGGLGTSDGRHAFSAGALGFVPPVKQETDPPAATLVQQPYTFDMLWLGHPGGHFGWTSPAFIAQWIAPLIVPADNNPAASRFFMVASTEQWTDTSRDEIPLARIWQ